jgi:hypothetical protein
MTDHATNGFGPVRTRRPILEYRIYFAIIFLVALPWAVISRLFGLGGEADAGKGVLARAWRQAGTITPLIFSV